MFTFKRTAAQRPAAQNAASAADACGCDIPPPLNDNSASEKGKPKGLRAIFKKCAMCATGATGGLLAGHAGCIITPVVLATAGATGLTAGMPVIALAFSIAATAGGLYAWHRLRGKEAGRWEKRIVIGGALAGVLVSSAFHLGGHHQQHGAMPPNMEMDMKMPGGCCGTTCPPAANTNRDTTVAYPAKPLPQDHSRSMSGHHMHGM